MSGFFPSRRGAASQARNPQLSYNRGSFSADGLQLSASGSPNVLGSYAPLFTTSAETRGLRLSIGSASSAAARYELTLRKGGNTIILPDLFFQMTATTTWQKVYLPLRVAGGVAIDAALRSSVSNATIRIGIEEVLANGIDAPGFDTCDFLTLGTSPLATASTRPSLIDVPTTDTWVEHVASTAYEYGALLAAVGDNGTTPTGGRVEVSLGLGANPSEAEFIHDFVNVGTTAPFIYGSPLLLIEHRIPFGSRISGRGYVTTPNSDNFRCGLWGFR